MTSSNALFRTSQATMSVSISVFLYEWFAYNIIFLGRILPAVGKGALITPFAVVFNIIWGLAMWSYARAHISDPGIVPKRWTEFVRSCDSLPIAPARPEWQPGKATYCKKCDVPRPERAHHCLYCEVCVLRMDHHCPWINNCVGYRNHKFFLLLGTYALMASLVGLATSLPELVYCAGALTRLDDGFVWEPSAATFKEYSGFISSGENILEDDMSIEDAQDRCNEIPACKGFTFQASDKKKGTPHIYFKDKWDIWGTGWTSFKRTAPRQESKLECTDIVVFLIFGILGLFVAMLLTPMLATHVPLAMQNLTTIEDNYENMPNPFDQGSTAANLAQVFGAYGPDWPFPIYPWKPLSDGVSFARSDERLGPDGLPERQDGEEEMDQEKLWRIRYHARTPMAAVQEVVDNGPLTSLARWWTGEM